MSDLLKRLRWGYLKAKGGGTVPVNPDGPEAADHIEAQGKRIAELEAALAAAREECARVAEAQVNVIGAGYGSSIWGALHGTAAAIRALPSR